MNLKYLLSLQVYCFGKGFTAYAAAFWVKCVFSFIICLVSYANHSSEFIAINAMSKPLHPHKRWSCGEELNPQHAAYKAAALPIELPQQLACI